MDLDKLVQEAITEIENLSPEEFEKELVEAGYELIKVTDKKWNKKKKHSKDKKGSNNTSISNNALHKFEKEDMILEKYQNSYHKHKRAEKVYSISEVGLHGLMQVCDDELHIESDYFEFEGEELDVYKEGV